MKYKSSMKLKITEMERRAGIDQTTLSNIFAGRRRPGRSVAERIGAVTGRPWHYYMAMEPGEIRADLEAALVDSDY